MDDFGMLAKDFGYRPQGKSAPMAPSKSSSSSAGRTLNFGIGSDGGADNNRSFNSSINDRDRGDDLLFDDVFGGPPKYTSSASDAQSGKGVGSRSGGEEFDALFQGSNSKSSSSPVFDKPVYDDDIFDGLPGVKNSANSSAKYDYVFSSISSPPSKHKVTHSDGFDDLMGNFGHKETESRSSGERVEKDAPVFDDLLPGFGGSDTPTKSQTSVSNRSEKQSSNSTTSNVMEDPFVVFESNSSPADSTSGLFTDPLEEFSKHRSSGKSRQDSSSVSEGVFDDIDPFDSLGKSVPPVLSETKYRPKDRISGRTGPSISGARTPSIEPIDKYPIERHERKAPVDNFQESHQTNFDMPNVSNDSHGSVGRTTSSSSYVNLSSAESNSQVDVSPRSEESLETADDVWLTVSEIPLFTQPTSAPPPSRPPPPRPARVSKPRTRSFGTTNAKEKVYEFSSFPSSAQYSHNPKSAHAAVSSSRVSQIDELEDFSMGRTWNNGNNEHENVHSVEEVRTSSDAAAAVAMKEAMDKAEARFKHAKEVREREHLKAARTKEAVLNEDEKIMQDNQEKEAREKQYKFDRERYMREKEEEEREHRRLEGERERAQEIEREREEKEREQRRLERERLKARQAVERATREARERAAAEARLKAEKAAIEKANADRERAERAAVQRAQTEARQRLAVEARERAERAAAEAREREARERASASRARAEAEARSRAERAAVERAAAEARERAASAARANQQKNDNDLESFFSMGTRPSSTPKSRANSSDPLFDTQAQRKERPDGARRTSVGSSSNIRKAASATNIVDDLTSIFGAATSSAGEFQDVEGESEERRRSRLERHLRTQERAAKALAEKNQRDLQAQSDQAERHRFAETLDFEIKRWSAGKEGNIRALLSTLQYVLWPECGWQPVSLTDLITAAAVKKVYRKATLCIHPDKVQQKGANIQQKYIAEKVFDLLKESWNKFNSEELF